MSGTLEEGTINKEKIQASVKKSWVLDVERANQAPSMETLTAKPTHQNNVQHVLIKNVKT